jgi:hypothetical protein
VWGGPHVSDTVLRVGIREIRVALADPVDAPQYLQTVGRQGDQWLVAGDGVAVRLAVARPIVGVEAIHTAFSPGGGHPPGAVLPGPPAARAHPARPRAAPQPRPGTSRTAVPAARRPRGRQGGRRGESNRPLAGSQPRRAPSANVCH